MLNAVNWRVSTSTLRWYIVNETIICTFAIIWKKVCLILKRLKAMICIALERTGLPWRSGGGPCVVGTEVGVVGEGWEGTVVVGGKGEGGWTVGWEYERNIKINNICYPENGNVFATKRLHQPSPPPYFSTHTHTHTHTQYIICTTQKYKNHTRVINICNCRTGYLAEVTFINRVHAERTIQISSVASSTSVPSIRTSCTHLKNV